MFCVMYFGVAATVRKDIVVGLGVGWKGEEGKYEGNLHYRVYLIHLPSQNWAVTAGRPVCEGVKSSVRIGTVATCAIRQGKTLNGLEGCVVQTHWYQWMMYCKILLSYLTARLWCGRCPCGRGWWRDEEVGRRVWACEYTENYTLQTLFKAALT